MKECYDSTGEGPVGATWTEINNGDEGNYHIRARLVAQDFTNGELQHRHGQRRRCYHQWEVAEWIGYGPGWQYKSYFIDMRKACLYSPSNETFTLTCPWRSMKKGCVGNWESRCTELGKLAASLNWEEEYVRFN